MSNLTLDIILLVLLLPAVFDGLKKGLILQASSLVALVLGVWLSVRFSALLCNYLIQYLPDFPVAVLKTIAFVLIFAVVALLLGILGRILRKMFKVGGLGWADRILGLLFALAKGALIIGLIILFFDHFNAKVHLLSEKTISESVLYTSLRDIASYIFPYLKTFITKS